MSKHPLETAIENHGITIKSEFVPFSKSRNASRTDNNGKPWLSLNWKVTLQRGGRDILTTDYGAGVAHCPSYNKKVPTGFDRPVRFWQKAVSEWECENGFEAEFTTWGGFKAKTKAVAPANDWEPVRRERVAIEPVRRERVAIEPKLTDVVHSLIMDASVLDSGGFEDWASELGYDTDSRNAESIYRACLEIALKLRAGLGEHALSELREAAQDY